MEAHKNIKTKKALPYLIKAIGNFLQQPRLKEILVSSTRLSSECLTHCLKELPSNFNQQTMGQKIQSTATLPNLMNGTVLLLLN